MVARTLFSCLHIWRRTLWFLPPTEKGTFILFPKGRVSPSLIQITQFYGRARVFFTLTRGSCEIKNHSQPHSFLEQQKWNKGRLLAGLVPISERGGDTLPSDSVWWNPAWWVQDPTTGAACTHFPGMSWESSSLTPSELGLQEHAFLGLSQLSVPYPAWNRLRVWGLLWTFNAGLTL